MRCEPEVLDFTRNESKATLILTSRQEELRIPLKNEGLTNLIGLLSAAIFHDPELSVIVWDLKNFVSYVKFRVKALLTFECNIIDLKVSESLLGRRGAFPGTFLEAEGRTKEVLTSSGWKNAKNIYHKIHKPLMFKVLPQLETEGLFDRTTRVKLFSHYDIEGEYGGRLACSKPLERCYNPHSIGPDERDRLRPCGLDEVFLLLDFKYMEVSMLHWLSQDDHLGQILDLDEDLYKVVFKLVTGMNCDSEGKRKMCKKFLLPVVFGQSAISLAEELNLPVITAEKIIDKIYNLFPKSLKWIQDQQDVAGDFCTDALGRRREFQNKRYRIRNFLVQSPAATVCLEKLIDLVEAIGTNAKLLCHIHDGYLMGVRRSFVKMVLGMAKDVLLKDSVLCPNLKLRLACKAGPTLKEDELVEC